MLHQSIFVWFGRRRQHTQVRRDLPLSEANDALSPDRRMIFFGGLGGVMGLFFLGLCLVTPLREWFRSRHWSECDAVIDRCALQSRSGVHGPEYSVDLLYTYEYAGRRHESTRRRFSMGIDEPVADLTAWVAAHPPGTSARCLVNPQDPSEAILDRRIRISWISLALGLLMSGFGLATFWQLNQARRLRRLSGALLADYCIGLPREGSVELRVRPSPWVLAVGCLAAVPPLAAAGAWSLLKGGSALQQGRSDLIHLLYGAGASIASVACAWSAGKHFRQARRPQPVFRVTPGTPRVSEPFHAEWKLTGVPDPKGAFRLWLEGVEYARIRQVTRGCHGAVAEEKLTEEGFALIPLAQHGPGDGQSGQLTATVPRGAMHTFSGAKCGVAWRFRVELARPGEKPIRYRLPVGILPPQS